MEYMSYHLSSQTFNLLLTRVLVPIGASYLRLKSPVPYRSRNVTSNSNKYGMNFATGGTGVFDTLSDGPNLTTQIDTFQSLLNSQSWTPTELRSSVALVTVSGNDYSSYLLTNGSIEGLPIFIVLVVNQLAADVRRIHELGVRTVVVSNLAPLGCVPVITMFSSYKQCNETLNILVSYHNQLLQQAVAKLNRTAPPSGFILADLYSSFSSALDAKGNNSKFDNPLKPCCVGSSIGYDCGSVDSTTGEKKYSVCSNPERALFWDLVHPTQAGWRAVFNNLKDTLRRLLNN